MMLLRLNMPDTPRDAVGGGKYKTVAEYINGITVL